MTERHDAGSGNEGGPRSREVHLSAQTTITQKASFPWFYQILVWGVIITSVLLQINLYTYTERAGFINVPEVFQSFVKHSIGLGGSFLEALANGTGALAIYSLFDKKFRSYVKEYVTRTITKEVVKNLPPPPSKEVILVDQPATADWLSYIREGQQAKINKLEADLATFEQVREKLEEAITANSEFGAKNARLQDQLRFDNQIFTDLLAIMDRVRNRAGGAAG